MEDSDLYVKYREHVAARDELRGLIQQMQLEHARSIAQVAHLPSKVDHMTEALAALERRIAEQQIRPADDQTNLAIHRLLDALSQKGGSNIERWLLLAMVGVSGWWLAHQFLGR